MASGTESAYGARLRRRREALSLTAEALAMQTGRTARTIALWEAGKVTPPRRVRVLIAGALDAPTLIELDA